MQARTGAGIAPQCVPLQLPQEVVTVLSRHRIRRHTYRGVYVWGVYTYTYSNNNSNIRQVAHTSIT